MIDAIYTWVDDRFPGFRDELERYAESWHDHDPGRTRDNLDLLKYSLRSLERYVPWVDRVFIISRRPQVPVWLNVQAPDVRVVHHDEFMEAKWLPTFNSHAIWCSLPRIAGISQRFLLVADDFLFGRPTAPTDFCTDNGRIKLRRGGAWSPSASVLDSAARRSPRLGALAFSNQLLDQRFRPERRRELAHAPQMIDLETWEDMECQWPAELERTRSTRFRRPSDIYALHLYPYFLHYQAQGLLLSSGRALWECWFQHADNGISGQRLRFACLRTLHPKFLCLNDGFGEAPHPAAVRLIKAKLEAMYPHPSRFEH